MICINTFCKNIVTKKMEGVNATCSPHCLKILIRKIKEDHIGSIERDQSGKRGS